MQGKTSPQIFNHAYQRLYATLLRMRRIKVLLIIIGITCVLLFQAFPKGSLREWNIRNASAAVLPQVFSGQHSNSSSNSSRNDLKSKNLELNVSQKPSSSELSSYVLMRPENNSQKNNTGTTGMLQRLPKQINGPNRTVTVIQKLPLKGNQIPDSEVAHSKVSSEKRNFTAHIIREDPLEAMKKLSIKFKGRDVPIFTPDTIHRIKSIPLVEEDKIVRVILVTYFRSGSSFLGDLLQQNWRTYFHFEPLHMMSDASRINLKDYPRASTLINNLLRCEMSKSPEYSTWVKKERNRFLIRWNSFLWSLCRMRPTYCFVSNYMEAVCLRSPIHVMKITRLTMGNVKQFLEDNPDLNVKVVYLVRDPRGIYNSRRFLNWCTAKKCSNVTYLCKEMEEDLQLFQDLRRAEPSRFILVRYEDISVNPEEEAKELFNFLDIPFSASVQRFLKTHTTARKIDIRNPYSTRRNSTATPFEWRNKLPYTIIQRAQESCSSVIDNLGYRPILKPADLTGNIPIIEKATAPVKDLTTHKEST